jgi:dTDP-4-amino-4,6-dideoxygalactose transaminase
MPKEINVTKTYLANYEEYEKIFREIWESRNITNNGKYLKLLEEKLKDKFVIDNAVCVSNGTIALQIAIEAVSDTRAVITTPFSYIATLNSILWQKRNH